MEEKQKSRMSFEESDMNPQLINVLKDRGITIMSEIQVSFLYIHIVFVFVKLLLCIYAYHLTEVCLF